MFSEDDEEEEEVEEDDDEEGDEEGWARLFIDTAGHMIPAPFWLACNVGEFKFMLPTPKAVFGNIG